MASGEAPERRCGSMKRRIDEEGEKKRRSLVIQTAVTDLRYHFTCSVGYAARKYLRVEAEAEAEAQAEALFPFD